MISKWDLIDLIDRLDALGVITETQADDYRGRVYAACFHEDFEEYGVIERELNSMNSVSVPGSSKE